MADTKITALTALTAADPINDVIPIVDVSDTSMAASGTTKKISVNNILGASGTATLASATITGAATVGTTLGVTGALSAASLALSGTGAGFTATATSGNSLNQIQRPTNATAGGIQLKTSSTNDWFLGLNATSDSDFHLLSYGTGADVLTVSRATGNLNMSVGNVVMATSGKGIDFSAVTGGTGTATGNVLNDYEEGTFTPTFTASSGFPTTVTVVLATYTKIGRRVSIDFDFVVSAIGSASGALYLTLPFSQSLASTPCGAFVEVSVVGYMGAIFQYDATRVGLNFYNNTTTWVNGYRNRGTYTYNV